MNYYVYAYLRENGTPYYIGKGKGRRTTAKHTINPPVDKSRIVFLETNLTEIGAFALERRYIKWYGRKDNNTGILRNMTDGGEGSSGRIASVTSRNKSSKSNLETWGKEETLIGYKESMKDIWANGNRNKKIANSVSGSNNARFGKPATNKDVPHSLETRRNMKFTKAKKRLVLLASRYLEIEDNQS